MRLGHQLAGPEGAPVLVLSHSVGTGRALWDEQMPVLTERFRVLRYDHRGHGESDAPPGPYSVADLAHDLLELLDELGVHRFTFCGLSLGGAVGMWLGSRAPERVERLVLCCTSARFEPHALWAERAAKVRADGLASISAAVVARWFTPEFVEGKPTVITRFRTAFEANDPDGYAACCEALGAWDFRDELGSIGVPTLVIAAEHDVATPPSDGAAIADGIPGGRLTVVPRAAHLANVEQPEAFLQAALA